MKAPTLGVNDPKFSMAEFAQAWGAGEPARASHVSLATPELLCKVLTAKRWELLKVLCGAGPVSIREAARLVNRSERAVHSDVKALLDVGMLDRAEDGDVEFGSETVEVAFEFWAGGGTRSVGPRRTPRW